ncbi:hypothetical protein E2C01_019262 [Portunus trituberculatus]|uniref:Uncharacterized protein n=1 Tax=Portunus trituberculatus TaxID=210409 RepID=A0A5B7DX41_PORTR|nr:hypothetical protein [Portunus trituberculatus]
MTLRLRHLPLHSLPPLLTCRSSSSSPQLPLLTLLSIPTSPIHSPPLTPLSQEINKLRYISSILPIRDSLCDAPDETRPCYNPPFPPCDAATTLSTQGKKYS